MLEADHSVISLVLHKSAQEILQIHFIFQLLGLCLEEKREQRIFFPSFSILPSATKRVKQCVCICIRDRKSICGKDCPRKEWKKLYTEARGHNTVTTTGQVWLKILQKFFRLQGKDFVFPSLVTYNLCFKVVFCLFSLRS